MKKRLCSVITAMILLICSTVFVFASEAEEVTWGDFLTQHGITLGEQPEVSYTTVSTGSIMTYSDNGSSAVRIKNPLSNGEVEEYLIVGMELADDEIQPTSFTANANARNTFLRTYCSFRDTECTHSPLCEGRVYCECKQRWVS